ncbi:MAG: endonuclease/exonuclease/phosphatase family protein [Eudoraea sp.]
MRYIFSKKTLLFFTNFLLALLLLVSCIASFFPVRIFPLLAFLSLVVPFLVVGNIIFLVYWLLKWNKRVFVPLLSLVISYIAFGPLLRLENHTQPISDKEDELTVMTFNTGMFWDDIEAYKNGESNPLLSFLSKRSPDILCLQESSRYRHNILKQYPYKYVTPKSSTKSLQGIFSKYPIVTGGSLEFSETANNAIYADIVYKNDTIRIYNLHLQSFQIRPGRIKRSKNPFRFYNRMETTFLKQEKQSITFNKHFKSCPYQKIVCADLNNTPFSYAYRLVKDDLIDTFDEKGSGFGMTYDINILPFRIDFIFVDKEMSVKSHENFKIKLSDHEPVMSSVQF